MGEVLQRVNHLVWGVPTLLLILLAGIYISWKTGVVQLTLLPRALKTFAQSFKRKKSADGVSPYQALCTALAATVGTGNLAGVAGAIALGGPGSVFWMWVCAFFGMAIKFAEATLAVCYRRRQPNGEYHGGPMYMIKYGMSPRWHWLAGVYSFFGVIAAFGVGNATQINAVIGGVNSVLHTYGYSGSQVLNLMIGLILAVLIGRILLGGAKKIHRAAERIVPIAAAGYIFLCVGVLIMRSDRIVAAFASILSGAFSPRAVTGGVIGSLLTTVRVGASRGTFTNEAGMGTAAMAHSSAEVKHPAQQGLMGIIEVFIDTIVICTLTALVILCSGVPICYGVDTGVELTASAFSSVYGSWVQMVITVALCAFAIATVIGWGLYGVRCAQYLFGAEVWKKFAILQVAAVLIGAVLNTGTVWLLSEIVNGLMAIPNLIALIALTPQLCALTKQYKKMTGRSPAVGGTYENFNQCKPLRTVSYAQIPSPGGEGGKRRKEDLPSQYRPA